MGAAFSHTTEGAGPPGHVTVTAFAFAALFVAALLALARGAPVARPPARRLRRGAPRRGAAGVRRSHRPARAPEGGGLHDRAHAPRRRPRRSSRPRCSSHSRSAAASRRSSRFTDVLPFGVMGRDLLLIVAVAVISGVVSLPFSYRQTFGIEVRFGFNRTTRKLWFVDLAKGVADRRRARPAARGARDVADARHRPVVVALGLGRVDRLPVPAAGALSDRDRPALQQVLAAAGGRGARRDRGAARALRFRQPRSVRDGRLAPLEPRQRVLHGLRPREAHRVLRHAARAADAGRGRGRARARARPLQAEARAEAHAVDGVRPRSPSSGCSRGSPPPRGSTKGSACRRRWIARASR